MTSTSIYVESRAEVSTTSYFDAVSQETVPAAQRKPVLLEVDIPPMASQEFGEAVNAFFGNTKPVHVWIDSNVGCVIDVERVRTEHVPVNVMVQTATKGVVTTSTDTPNSTTTLAYYAGYGIDCASVEVAALGLSATAVDTPRDPPNVTDFAYDMIRTVPLSVVNSDLETVKVVGLDPRKITFSNKPYCCIQPNVSITPASTDKAAIVWAAHQTGARLYKVYGWITSSDYTEVMIPITDPVTKALTWKKFFQTLGKTIKVIAEVAKVVLPFVIGFLLLDELNDEGSRRIKAAQAKSKFALAKFKPRPKPKQQTKRLANPNKNSVRKGQKSKK